MMAEIKEPPFSFVTYTSIEEVTQEQLNYLEEYNRTLSWRIGALSGQTYGPKGNQERKQLLAGLLDEVHKTTRFINQFKF